MHNVWKKFEILFFESMTSNLSKTRQRVVRLLHDHGDDCFCMTAMFRYMREDINYDPKSLEISSRNGKSFCRSEFDRMLQDSWEKAMRSGLFRFSLDHVRTKVLPGKMGLVAQLNVKRASDRRKPQQMLSVREPFDPGKFNFNKISGDEALFQLVPETTADEHNEKKDKHCQHLLIINDSPITFGHVLLVPRMQECLPQVLTEESIMLALDVVRLSHHRGLRIAFNSVGAFASVNHLHFHALYINHSLPIENAEVVHVAGGCYEIINSHTRGFAFQLYGQSPDSLAKLLFRVVSLFVESDIPHNLFMCRANVFPSKQKGRISEPLPPDCRDSTQATVQVFLWPRKPTFGAVADISFQSASIEPAGFLLVKDPNHFDHLTEEEAIRILESFSMSEEEFNVIKEQVLERLDAEP